MRHIALGADHKHWRQTSGTMCLREAAGRPAKQRHARNAQLRDTDNQDRQRRAPEAVGVFRGALHFMPDSPSLYENLDKALRLAGRNDEAVVAAQQAARLREMVRKRAADV